LFGGKEPFLSNSNASFARVMDAGFVILPTWIEYVIESLISSENLALLSEFVADH
jgi:hypothetical protein